MEAAWLMDSAAHAGFAPCAKPHAFATGERAVRHRKDATSNIPTVFRITSV